MVWDVSEEQSSIWVNGEIKKTIYDDYLLWDPSKKFSLCNETDDDIIYLNIDIKRHPKVKLGYAPNEIPKEWNYFINKIIDNNYK